MLFNSIQFLVFFPVVVLLYFLVGYRYRWFLLLAASCVFYAAFIPAYLLILFALILVDYFAALFIAKVEGKKRKFFLSVSILSTCLILFVFKYFNFFSVNLGYLAAFLHWNYSPQLLHLILPIGLSFHTFQSLSYVVEVYKGRQEPEKHFGIYALYVVFFPQLVAGPIERPQNMLHQFHEKHDPDRSAIASGLRQMLYGYFKKMVIADNLAPYVDPVYAHPAGSGGNMIIIAIQIYCDFSGYSDIAIGAARIMGFKLMDNFNFPYFARSFTDFWKRWHISLSSWFRDYVYIPLGGNRVSEGRMYYNLFMVFLLSALWHGAGWTFIIWGMLHAFYLIAEHIINRLLRKATPALPHTNHLYNAMCMVFIFLLTTFAWIFFRATDINNAFEIVRHISFKAGTFITDLNALAKTVHQSYPERAPLSFVVLSLLLFATSESVLYKANGVITVFRLRTARWVFYYGVIAWILMFGVYDIAPNFIYFQF